MIPNALQRKSIKAVAQYILYDKGVFKTQDRVDWTHTMNMATSDPDTAWRMMARTVKLQDYIKAENGVRVGGRKTEYPAYHLMLMWHPSEAPTKAEMIQAAREAIGQIGMGDHQVLMVAHKDEPQAHVHLLINSIHPVTGLKAKVSFDRLKLQDWATLYEYEHGVHCWARIENAAKREGGAYIRHQRKDSANPVARERRAAEQARAAAKRIKDPHYLLRVLTQEKASFTPFEAKSLIERYNNAIPANQQYERSQLDKAVLELVSSRFSVQLGDGSYTPNELLAIEAKYIERAVELNRDRDGFRVSTETADSIIKKARLSEHQADAFKDILNGGRFVMLEGIAGAGKSRLLSGVREAFDQEGYEVVGLGPMHSVVNDLKSLGFEGARTVHSALAQQAGPIRETETWNSKTVVLLEEAAMLGTRRLEELQRVADEAGAKLIMVGDDGQFPPVKQTHGLWRRVAEQVEPARLNDVVRQSDPQDQAITRALSDRQYNTALRTMYERDQLRAVKGSGVSVFDEVLGREVYLDNRIVAAVQDHHAHRKADGAGPEFYKRNILVGLGGETVWRMNMAVQARRHEDGELGHAVTLKTDMVYGEDMTEVLPPGLPEYDTVEQKRVELKLYEGDRIRFGHHDRERGIFKGDMGFVRSARDVANIIIRTDDGRDVVINGNDTPTLRLGYALSDIQTQGVSVDTSRAVVTQQWRGYAAYVAASRHTAPKGVTFYATKRGDGMMLSEQLAIEEHEGTALDRLKQAEDLTRFRNEYPRIETTPFKQELREFAALARDELLNRQGTFSRAELKRTVSNAVYSAEWDAAARPHSAVLDDLAREIEKQPGMLMTDAGRLTNHDQLKTEHEIMTMAQAMNQNSRHQIVLTPEEERWLRAGLNPEQYAVIRGLARDGAISFVEGPAGTGKGKVISVGQKMYRNSGYDVRGLAPTSAVAGDMSENGIDARTIHSAFKQQERGHRKGAWTANTVLFIDEASMIGAREMKRLMAHVKASGAKAIFMFDRKQLDPVGSPAGMAGYMADTFGVHRLTAIQRQKAGWMRDASKDLGQGNVERAIDAYGEHRAIKFAKDAGAAETKLVERYMQLTKPDVKLEPAKRAEQQEQAMRDITTMSFRHKVLERLNTRIREARIERGDLDRGQQFETAHGIINANVGDRIIFGKNDNTRGLRNNDKALITGIEGTTITAMLDRDRSTVSFDTAHYQEWKLGYASTIHAAQGHTSKHALVMHSDHMQSEAAYVAMTRHTDTMQMFVDRSQTPSRKALVKQLSASRNKPSALAQFSEQNRRKLGYGLIAEAEKVVTPDEIRFEQGQIDAALEQRLDQFERECTAEQDKIEDTARKTRIDLLDRHREHCMQAYGARNQHELIEAFQVKQEARRAGLAEAAAEGDSLKVDNIRSGIERAEERFKENQQSLSEDEDLLDQELRQVSELAQLDKEREDRNAERSRIAAIIEAQHHYVDLYGRAAPIVDCKDMSRDERIEAREAMQEAYASKPNDWYSSLEQIRQVHNSQDEKLNLAQGLNSSSTNTEERAVHVKGPRRGISIDFD